MILDMAILLIIFIGLILIGFVIEFLKKCGTILGYIVTGVLAIVIIIIFFPLVIKLLPYIIFILATYFVIHAISNSSIFMKKRAYSYLKKLDNKGVDQPEITPKYESAFKWIKENEYAEFFLHNYIVSIKFYKKVIYYLDQKHEMSKTDFQNCCVECAPQFSVKHTDLFAEFLHHKKLLFPFLPPNEEKAYYISTKLIKECEYMFEKKGAVTEDEFAEICKGLFHDPFLRKKRSQLAATILKDMHSRSVLHIVNLDNVDLYIANNQKADSEMKRVLINLDD